MVKEMKRNLMKINSHWFPNLLALNIKVKASKCQKKKYRTILIVSNKAGNGILDDSIIILFDAICMTWSWSSYHLEKSLWQIRFALRLGIVASRVRLSSAGLIFYDFTAMTTAKYPFFCFINAFLMRAFAASENEPKKWQKYSLKGKI